MIKEDRAWIRRIWRHYWRARTNWRFSRTTFWGCVRATVAVVCGRWADVPDGDYDWFDVAEEVAWRNEGIYHTDYGEGKAWTALHVHGWRVQERTDGSL